MISHAITIRTLQLQEFVEARERAQFIEQYCPQAPRLSGNLIRRCQSWLNRAMAESRAPHMVRRVATQG